MLLNQISLILADHRICEEYESIADQALSTPPGTPELMQLINFVEKAKNELVFSLEERLKEVLQYIMFLSDYSLLTPVEIKTVNAAFHW